MTKTKPIQGNENRYKKGLWTAEEDWRLDTKGLYQNAAMESYWQEIISISFILFICVTKVT